MNPTKTTDSHSLQNALGHLESIRDLIRRLELARAGTWSPEIVPDDTARRICHLKAGDPVTDRDRRAAAADLNGTGSPSDSIADQIQEEAQAMALSVEVRSGWASPGEAFTPTEYRILLTYGGPACQITGELSEHGEPETAHLEHQDWGTQWTPVRGCDIPGDVEDMTAAESDLLAFASLFYFGE